MSDKEALAVLKRVVVEAKIDLINDGQVCCRVDEATWRDAEKQLEAVK